MILIKNLSMRRKESLKFVGTIKKNRWNSLLKKKCRFLHTRKWKSNLAKCKVRKIVTIKTMIKNHRRDHKLRLLRNYKK